MRAEDNSDSTNPNQTPGLQPGVQFGLIAIATLTVGGGVMRAIGRGTWDRDTLMFFLAAAIIILLPWVAKLKFGKDGFELEMQRSEYEKAKKLVDQLGAGSPSSPGKAKSLATEGVDDFDGLARDVLAPETVPTKPPTDEADPQKGQFGGHEVANGRRLSATVKQVALRPEWFIVRLLVSQADLSKPLSGKVTFYLHPTFKTNIVTVPVKNGKAMLEIVAWGAFTVGAKCDDAQTPLELNLATLPDAPEKFRSR